MNAYPSIAANYRPYPGRRHAGNAFVEALPLDDTSIARLQTSLANIPDPPTPAMRKLPDIIRLDELNELNDYIYARPQYMRMAPLVLSAIKEAYVGRNPVHRDDLERRVKIAQMGDVSRADRLPTNWKTHAAGLALFGISGGGKTTFIDRLLLPLSVVIEHTSYLGQVLRCRQVPALKLSIPHDGTVKSLCLQFFANVDTVLGNTEYLKQARAVRSVSQMVLLIVQVATSISLAFIALDELQNLRAAQGPQAEQVLNLFSQIMELAGVSIMVIGTPAVQRIMEPSLRNIRKISQDGEFRLNAMPWNSAELKAFQDEFWPHQWTREVGQLTQEIRRAWYVAGGGNLAFMASSFKFAQRIEIGGRERLDETSFARASARFMSSVQPAIEALVKGDRKALERFDDLIFTEEYDNLRSEMGWRTAGQPRDTEAAEFDEFKDAAAKSSAPSSARSPGKSKRKSTASGQCKTTDEFPVEDPLLRM